MNSKKKKKSNPRSKGLTDFNKGRIGNNPYHPYDDFDEYREYEMGFKYGYFQALSKQKKLERDQNRARG